MKNNRVLKFLLGLCLMATFNVSYAGTLTCSASSSGYCQYSGKVSRVYVNRSNTLLIYTDELMDLSSLSNAGDKFSAVTSRGAIAVNMNTYPEFGKHVLSMALSAGMADKKIVMQMRDRHSVYLQADRIWLYK